MTQGGASTSTRRFTRSASASVKLISSMEREFMYTVDQAHWKLRASLAATLLAVAASSVSAQTPPELMAVSGGELQSIDALVGINNAGTVAFVARNAIGSEGYVSHTPGAWTEITFFASATRTYGGAAINNAAQPQVAIRDRVSGAPGFWLVRRWNADGSRLFDVVGRSPTHFDSAATYVDLNDSGQIAFSALVSGSTRTRLYVGSAEPPTTVAEFSGNVLVRPQISNSGEIVARDNQNRILVWTIPGPLTTQVSTGVPAFVSVGAEPGISANGDAVAFAGDRGTGNGVFVSIRNGTMRQLLRLAGERSDSFTDIDAANRVGVTSMGAVTDANGLRGTAVFVGTLDGLRGVYAADFTARLVAGTLRTTLSCAFPVVVAGDAVGGRTVAADFRLFDPINAGGTVALWATLTDGSSAVIRATPRRVTPIRQCDARWGDVLYAADDATPPTTDLIADFSDRLRDPKASPAALLPPNQIVTPTWADAAEPMGVIDQADLVALADRLDADRDEITICAKGCALSSFTMAANQLLERTNTPAEVHAHLITNNQITAATRFQRYNAGQQPRFVGLAAGWAGVHQFFGNAVTSTEIASTVAVAQAEVQLRDAFDDGALAIINVNGGGHWVFSGCYRVEEGQTQFHIIDPGRTDGSRDGFFSLAGLNNYHKARIVRRVAAGDGPLQLTGVLQTSGGVSFLLTDSLGQRLGTAIGEVAEIPGGSFGTEFPISTPDEVYSPEEIAELEIIAERVAFLNELTPGRYTLDVTELLGGGYTCRLTILGSSGAARIQVFTGETAPGEVDRFTFSVPTLRGDMNCDGAVNFDDINGFVVALVGEAAYVAQFPGCVFVNGDIDANGDVTFNDIAGFVSCLAVGACP